VEPTQVEYIRICDAYGSGYFYIPADDRSSRLRIGGCGKNRDELARLWERYLKSQVKLVGAIADLRKVRRGLASVDAGTRQELSDVIRNLRDLDAVGVKLVPRFIVSEGQFKQVLMAGDFRPPGPVQTRIVERFAQDSRELGLRWDDVVRERDLQVSNTPSASQVPPEIAIFLGTGYRFARLPKVELGVANLGVNTTPLINIKQNLDGFAIKGGVEVGPLCGCKPGDGWFFGLNGDYADLSGNGSQTINVFSLGQQPVNVDLSGTGGFQYNNNARVAVRSNLDTFKIGAESGYRYRLNDVTIVKPYGGLFYRRIERRQAVTLDTDFLGGTFFNTLNENITTSQYGADVGADLTWSLGERFRITLGGHVGLAYTDANYTGSDCGDGSILTPGCDGTLYRNTNVRAGNNSWDPFGGIKLIVAADILCRNDVYKDAAAGRAGRGQCLEVALEGTYDVVPGQKAQHPTALNGVPVGLATDYEEFGAVMLTGRIKF
ncbi:MAG: porin, partial [Pseudomonadota bacterium]